MCGHVPDGWPARSAATSGESARARNGHRHGEHLVPVFPVEQRGGDLALVADVERVAEPDHRVEQCCARCIDQRRGASANGGGDAVTCHLPAALVEQIRVVAPLGSAARVSVEDRLQDLRRGTELVEGDQRHGEMVAVVAPETRREGQLVVEESTERR